LKDWGLDLPRQIYRLGFALFLLLLGACSKGQESVDVFMPRLDISPEVASRRAALCTPDRLSLRSFDSNKGILDSQEFRNFFDCANADGKFRGLEAMVHSPASPRFFSALMDSVNSLASNSASLSIRDRIQPWFQESQQGGESRIDRILPIIADVIKNSVFRRAMPLISSVMQEGGGVWTTFLPQFARFVYDPRYPTLWLDLRKLFNVRTAAPGTNHLAISTREFFAFLQKTNPDPTGAEKTNAHQLLEILNELETIGPREGGMLSLWEYAHNRDVFTTLYQTASGGIRGEVSMPELNGGGAMGGASPEQVEQNRKQKFEALFVGGATGSPILSLVGLVATFNEPRPTFLPAISQWFAKISNQERIHTGLVEFVAKRMVEDILNNLRVSRYLNDYVRSVLRNQVMVSRLNEATGERATVACERRGLDCAISGEEFGIFLAEAFAHPSFEEWITRVVNEENGTRFRDRNAELLARHGGLVRDIIAIYKSDWARAYAGRLVGQRIALRTAITNFSSQHLATDGPVFSYTAVANEPKQDSLYNHLISAWYRNLHAALGESIVIHEAFRVVALFFSEFIAAQERDPASPTLAQQLFRATYNDPSLMERVVYEARRSRFLDNLDERLRWLKNDLGPEIFQNESDLNAFRSFVDQIPNILLYVESGMARSGNNLLRTLSERDRGYLIRSYVNLITQAHAKGLIAKGVSVWKNFMDFLEVRDERLKAGAEQYRATLSPRELALEREREARRISDGVDALKRVGRALFRPRVEGDWNTSMAGEMLTALQPLANARKSETESWLLHLAERTVAGSDEDIDAVYRFFSPDGNNQRVDFESEADVALEAQFRKDVADLIRHPRFPEVLVDLDRLFSDDAVQPALDFLAERIDRGEITRLLELARKLMGIEGYRR
jgi:hypothetical protein